MCFVSQHDILRILQTTVHLVQVVQSETADGSQQQHIVAGIDAVTIFKSCSLI